VEILYWRNGDKRSTQMILEEMPKPKPGIF